MPDVLECEVQVNASRETGGACDADLLPGQHELALAHTGRRQVAVPCNISLITPGVHDAHIVTVAVRAEGHPVYYPPLGGEHSHRVALGVNSHQVYALVKLFLGRGEGVGAWRVEAVGNDQAPRDRIDEKEGR